MITKIVEQQMYIMNSALTPFSLHLVLGIFLFAKPAQDQSSLQGIVGKSGYFLIQHLDLESSIGLPTVTFVMLTLF